MLVRQIEEVQPSDDLCERQTNQPERGQRRDDAKDKRADQSVLQCLVMLTGRKTEHHDGHDHGVVRAQKSFQNNENADSEQVSPLEHPEIIPGID